MRSRLDLRALAFIATIAAGFVGPAGAQTEPLDPQVTTLRAQEPAQRNTVIPNALVRQIEKDLAKCVTNRKPELVEKILANSDAVTVDPAKIGYSPAELLDKLGLDYCLEKMLFVEGMEMRLTFKPSKLRANFAEETYLRRHRSPMVRSAGWTEVIAERVSANGESESLAKLRGSFSDCLVFNAAEKADALLRTQVESAAEMAAVKALVPAISGCLYEGDKLDFTPAMVRQYAADGLWARSYYQGTATAPAAVRTDVSAKRD